MQITGLQDQKNLVGIDQPKSHQSMGNELNLERPLVNEAQLDSFVVSGSNPRTMTGMLRFQYHLY